MTRKYILLFVILASSSFFLLLGLFGEHGFFVNRELQKQLKQKEYELDKLNAELENLQLQEQELGSEAGLKDAAMHLGYNVEGDEVYFFNDSDEIVSPKVKTNDSEPKTEEKSFKSLEKPIILLISFGSSALITLIVFLINKKKKRSKDDTEQTESGNFRDSLGLD